MQIAQYGLPNRYCSLRCTIIKFFYIPQRKLFNFMTPIRRDLDSRMLDFLWPQRSFKDTQDDLYIQKFTFSWKTAVWSFILFIQLYTSKSIVFESIVQTSLILISYNFLELHCFQIKLFNQTVFIYSFKYNFSYLSFMT